MRVACTTRFKARNVSIPDLILLVILGKPPEECTLPSISNQVPLKSPLTLKSPTKQATKLTTYNSQAPDAPPHATTRSTNISHTISPKKIPMSPGKSPDKRSERTSVLPVGVQDEGSESEMEGALNPGHSDEEDEVDLEDLEMYPGNGTAGGIIEGESDDEDDLVADGDDDDDEDEDFGDGLMFVPG